MDDREVKKIVFYPRAVEEIRYLNKIAKHREWGGQFLYTIEGNTAYISRLLPMDIGTQGFTSYTLPVRLKNGESYDPMIDLCMEDPGYLQYKLGGIHSHNFMPVFFSGTDLQELKETGKLYDQYLSVVVNNNEDCIAVNRTEGINKMVHTHFIDHNNTGLLTDEFKGWVTILEKDNEQR